MKIGIIGNGFVGEAQAFAFSPVAEVYIYDVNPLRSLHTREEVYKCDFVFVAVPTPMCSDGSQDLKYIDQVFSQASGEAIYIIKSTVLPGTTESLITKYPNLKIVFSPEFLTERTSKLDMMTQSRIIIGSDSENLGKEVEGLFASRFMNRHYIHTDTKTAELIKYMNNTFFATKVSIMNEFKRLSDKIGANWEEALHGFVSDGRIADSHLNVPGPDGMHGYGGVCFPKDVNALISFSKKLNVPMHTIEAGWKTNLEVREHKEWEQLKGRGVSE
jgi:UDPglucose 6-dehydrogenase